MVEPLAAVLRGELAGVSALAAGDRAAVIAAARAHGVLPLVADACRRRDAPLASAMAAAVRADLLLDMAREQELRALLEAFARAQVDALLIKGAALAYTHYPRPDLRPRIDTDLLVAPERRAAAHDVLVAGGYMPATHVAGALVLQQATYERAIDGAGVHTVDLHWQIANPHVFARVLTHRDLSARSVPVPALGPAARTVSAIDALMVAAIHRVAHHAGVERLIWTYDMHLLASGFSHEDWHAWTDRAHARGVATVCRRGLELAMARFGTAVPADILADGRLDPTAHAAEPSARFVDVPAGPFDVLLSDLRVLGWGARVRLIGEHLLPSADYMRQVYAPASHAPLSWLYAQRAWRGAWKWLGRR